MACPFQTANGGRTSRPPLLGWSPLKPPQLRGQSQVVSVIRGLAIGVTFRRTSKAPRQLDGRLPPSRPRSPPQISIARGLAELGKSHDWVLRGLDWRSCSLVRSFQVPASSRARVSAQLWSIIATSCGPSLIATSCGPSLRLGRHSAPISEENPAERQIERTAATPVRVNDLDPWPHLGQIDPRHHQLSIFVIHAIYQPQRESGAVR